MGKKIKNEFDGLTVDELKTRRDECQRSIDDLIARRQKLDDKIHIDILNGNLKRIMGKWVKVKNYAWIDESNEEVDGYRVFKVVGVESWIQDNRFKIIIEDGVLGQPGVASFEYNTHNGRFVNFEEGKTADLPRKQVVWDNGNWLGKLLQGEQKGLFERD